MATKVSLKDKLARMVVLEEEIESILNSMTIRAVEYYRALSGREHFHTPKYLRHDADFVWFYTPVREEDIEFRIPIEFFG